MKTSETRSNPLQEQWTNQQERERENILRPELFSVPRHSHLLTTKERRKGEERSLVGKYLELADIALSNPPDDDAPAPSNNPAKEPENDAA